jgi:pimeloyl-ACP methyl ester carboxylesterase
MTDPETVVVGDGRRLAYEECGRADGHPVVCCHGNPGSRLVWSLFDETAQHHDVRLIAPDRPGFGQSEFQPDRSLPD